MSPRILVYRVRRPGAGRIELGHAQVRGVDDAVVDGVEGSGPDTSVICRLVARAGDGVRGGVQHSLRGGRGGGRDEVCVVNRKG